MLGDGRLLWVEVLVSVAIIPLSCRCQDLLINLALPKAQLEIFDDQLAHLLWKGPLSWKGLQNLPEDGRVGQVVIGRKHEEFVFLLILPYDLMWIFFCKTSGDIVSCSLNVSQAHLLETKLAGSVHCDTASSTAVVRVLASIM